MKFCVISGKLIVLGWRTD